MSVEPTKRVYEYPIIKREEKKERSQRKIPKSSGKEGKKEEKEKGRIDIEV